MSAKIKKLLPVGVLLVSVVTIVAVFTMPHATPGRIVISDFNSPSVVEYGSRDFNLAVTGANVSESPFGHSLKLVLRMVPGSYNFVASGDGLADKKNAWENKPANLDWSTVKGLSYKVYVESVKGAPVPIEGVRIATDVIDGDGEIMRSLQTIPIGKWVEQNVLFSDLETRYDYQRDWKAVKWTGTGPDKKALSQVDNGVRSYQFEVIGFDKPVDISANQVEVTLYLDEVALLKK